MVRSLWTAASGMSSQQLTIDAISNNLANVNTTGYKREKTEFKSLLYETLERANLDKANTTGRNVNLQVGHGVTPFAISRMFSQGNLQASDNNLDLAINGDGFFVVNIGNDNYRYTRDGSLKVSLNNNNEYVLATSDGYPFLGIDDQPIILPQNIIISSLVIDESGILSYINEGGEIEDLGYQIKLVQFPNTQGLEAIGANLYNTTSATGDVLVEANGEVLKPSKLIQNMIESSNVEIGKEMIDLIVAQRAYELNSKTIQASDEMLQQANNMKR